MDLFEIYLLLFTDVLTSSFAFNVSSEELVLSTMKTFGNYSKQLMLFYMILYLWIIETSIIGLLYR